MKIFSESERDKINPEPSIYPFAQNIATATDQHFIPSGCVYSMKVGWLDRFGQGYDINSFHMGAEPLWDCNFYFQTGSYSAAQTGLELMTIFLPQPSGCWDYRYKPSQWDYNLIFWAVIWFFFAILILHLPYKVTLWGLLQTYPEIFPEFLRLGETSLFWGFKIPFATVGMMAHAHNSSTQEGHKEFTNIFICVASMRTTWNLTQKKYLCILWLLLSPDF